MAQNRSWQGYPADYRAAEINTLVNWIVAGESGSVVGLAGCGRSNLLGFLCHRPEVLNSYLSDTNKQAVALLVDLNNLPANDLSTIYRAILRTFYQFRDRFDKTVAQTITHLYIENRVSQDPFLSHSAVLDLLTLLQDEEIQVALVLNRFDRFCQTVSPHTLNTLRGLRDSFKDTLCYIVGMRQEVGYFSDPDDLGDMYELLDNRICWVGRMSESDARYMINQIISVTRSDVDDTVIEAILALSGFFPIVIKALCHWWLANPDQLNGTSWAKILKDKQQRSRFERMLMTESGLQYRFKRIWRGLTQEEQLVLSEIRKVQAQSKGQQKHLNNLIKRQPLVFERLKMKGVCDRTEKGWSILGNLMAAFVDQVEGRSRGKIWIDDKAEELYQGQQLLEGLTNLQATMLKYLVNNPRAFHSKTDLIFAIWPDQKLRDGEVSDDALYQVIKGVRNKIEPNPSKPHYLITWRATPENGYKFYPEGKPEPNTIEA